MIVADTSAFMAILLDEPQAKACIEAIDRADALLLSAGTMPSFSSYRDNADTPTR